MSGFVKLDCGMLNSTIWMDRPAREIFITALLMAEPREYSVPTEQISVRTLDLTGWSAPAGWYGFVPAAGIGIVRQAGLETEAGLDALERLGKPEPDSRNPAFEGRRMVRIDGGYLILNYARFRERNYTNAERQRRFRERKKAEGYAVTARDSNVTSQPVTQAEGEEEVEADRKKNRSVAAKLDSPKVLTLTGEPYKPATEAEAISGIFDYYVVVMKKSRTVLDDKRRNLIRNRLREGWTPEQLMTAIAGNAGDAWSQGSNDRGTPFNELSLILRDAEHIEKFIRAAGSPSRPRSKAEQRTASNVDAAYEFLRRTDPEGRK